MISALEGSNKNVVKSGFYEFAILAENGAGKRHKWFAASDIFELEKSHIWTGKLHLLLYHTEFIKT